MGDKKVSALVRSRTGRQFGRYSVVGLSGFVIDFGIYTALTRGFDFWRAHNIGANVIAFSCAVINNYVWHKLWTFRQGADPAPGAATARLRSLGGQFSVFVVVSVIGLALNSSILHAVSHQPPVRAYFGAQADLFAKAVAVPIVWIWNFSANKLWTFRKG